MIWMWLTGAALAGNVYLNGTFIDPIQVAGLEMKDVDVKVDPQGNIHIDAPGYKVEVMAPPVAPATAPGATAAYGAPAPAPANSAYGAQNQAYGAQPAPQPYGQAAPAPQAYGNAAAAPQQYSGGVQRGAAMNPNGLAKASWWLVTEDNGSGGHAIDIIINNQVAHSLRSGQAQQIVDISAFLKKGDNQVLVKSNSNGATGGTLYVYIGPGNDQSGTVVMDKPEVQFGVGSSRTGPYQREYAIQVN